GQAAGRVAHFGRGATVPLVPRRGPLRARRPRPVRGSATPSRGAGHLSESAAASKAVNRETERRPPFQRHQRSAKPNRVILLRTNAYVAQAYWPGCATDAPLRNVCRSVARLAGTKAARRDIHHRSNHLAGTRTRALDRGHPRRTRQTAVWGR